MPKFEINIDHELCWGCKTCEVACKQENRAADGVKLISVAEDGPRLIDDKLEFVFQVNLCRHCDDPPCADVCPEEAPMSARRRRSTSGMTALWSWITICAPAARPVLMPAPTMLSHLTTTKASPTSAISVTIASIRGLFRPVPTMFVRHTAFISSKENNLTEPLKGSLHEAWPGCRSRGRWNPAVGSERVDIHSYTI